MSTSRPSRRQQRSTASAPAFPNLALGIQNGLRRLVSDNAGTVAKMLDCNTSAVVDVDELCEQCASIMKQQQMSPSTFLASFFDTTLLSKHAVDVLQKSGKGSAAVLAERIASEWLKNKTTMMTTTTTTTKPLLPTAVTAKSQTEEEKVAKGRNKRETASSSEVVSSSVPKRANKAAASVTSETAPAASVVSVVAQSATKKNKATTIKKN